MIIDLLKDAAMDSVRLLPFLFLTFLILEFLQRYSQKLNQKMLAQFQKAGPLIGALLGCIPECGIPVLTANLFSASLISPGTLLSVFLSTSDEAILVLLGTSNHPDIITELLIIKFFIAVICGYAMDFFFAKQFGGNKKTEIHTHSCSCSGHSHNLLVHAFQHTVNLFCYIFLFTLVLNFLLEIIGFPKLASVLLKGSLLQPVLTAVIGLIPSCASSILLTKLYVQGILSFASFIAGLCSTTGIGLAVLAKTHPDKKE
ncbi:MAG: putative manganese transporter, partial [Porphyromonadaceae bacterium]|nr:putative manganese transporter [Porphyromonadaceae bacterium]